MIEKKGNSYLPEFPEIQSHIQSDIRKSSFMVVGGEALENKKEWSTRWEALLRGGVG